MIINNNTLFKNNMKYTLLKKWHPSQVEEVGHVFEEKSSESYITYKVKRDDGYVNYYLDIQPHEIALLVHAGYLGKEREHQASLLDPSCCKHCDILIIEPADPTLDIWTEEPAKGTQCWFITDYGDVDDFYFCGATKADQFRLKTKNCHKTKKSAEEALKRLLS